MSLDIPALAIGLLGGGSLATLIVFFAFYKTEKRRKVAEARKAEMEGDLLSIEYFRESIEQLKADSTELKAENKELKEENKELKAEVKQLRSDVDELKEGKSDLADQLEKYKEAAKMLKDCPNNKTCPMAKEYHKLIGKE